jgi:single-stranded-DNA-specific exonuclease
MTLELSEQAQKPRWITESRDPDSERRLVKELQIPTLVAALLAQRGFTDPAEAWKFLNPSLDDLGDPRSLPDYEAAQSEILKARESKDLIYVHGDYDVDGVTSAAIFHRFLGRVGCQVHTHVPHRTKEGYGIALDAVEEAKKLGAKLFLTCDCGIAAHEQVERAKEAGMTVVVTDHHAIAGELPDAAAVVNPHRIDSEYPFEELSGAGVAFRICEGLTKELNLPVAGYRRAFLDLAALGTIADVMPLLGENRIIAKFGLEQIQASKKVGIQALMRESGVGQDPMKPVCSRDVGWQLGPRLNAVGRIEDAAAALQLLIEQDEAAATILAKELEKINFERRALTEATADEAEELILEQGLQNHYVIVVAKEGWHTGIVGIVASRLVQRFNRPCFVMTISQDGAFYKGSARSIPQFHLAQSIWAHPDLMQGGGHAMAAGCHFPVEKLTQVRDALDTFGAARLSPDDLYPTIRADMEITSDEVTLAAAEGLLALEPFGAGNPEPVFLAKNVSLSQIQQTRAPQHARLVLKQDGGSAVQGIAFGIGEMLAELGAGTTGDLLFRPDVNEFRGSRDLQWKVRDFRPH